MKTKYMHLIDNCPGRFSGKQICYAGEKGFKVTLVNSLKQIKKEQKLSKEFRESQGWCDTSYSYVLVEIKE